MEGSTSAMDTISSGISTAITGVTGDIASAVADNLPAVLGVGAIFILIPAVWKLVKRFAK